MLMCCSVLWTFLLQGWLHELHIYPMALHMRPWSCTQNGGKKMVNGFRVLETWSIVARLCNYLAKECGDRCAREGEELYLGKKTTSSTWLVRNNKTCWPTQLNCKKIHKCVNRKLPSRWVRNQQLHPDPNFHTPRYLMVHPYVCTQYTFHGNVNSQGISEISCKC